MDSGRLGYRRPSRNPSIGDLVICVDMAREGPDHANPKKFIGLVLDKSVTVYKIQIIETGKETYWPKTATFLWKEPK